MAARKMRSIRKTSNLNHPARMPLTPSPSPRKVEGGWIGKPRPYLMPYGRFLGVVGNLQLGINFANVVDKPL